MTAPLLQLHDVTVRFGGLTALNAFNLSVRQGETFGLVGPNGAGKTTVLDVICGLVQPSEGSVVLSGQDLKGLPLHARARCGLARSFQTLRLFGSLSVFDHVQLAADQTQDARLVRHLLPAARRARSELTARAEALLGQFGLMPWRDQTASSLPLAAQRRLALARCLALKPTLLLLDEPAAGLSPPERDEFARLILQVRKELGLTILIAEHSMKLVRDVCERLVVLDFGMTIAEGPPAAARLDPKVVAAYLGEEPGGSEESASTAPPAR